MVGEHRRYDERLAMFLLRYRDPMRYAKGWDKLEPIDAHEELFAVRLAKLMLHIESDNADLLIPVPPPPKKEDDEGIDESGEGEVPPDVA